MQQKLLDPNHFGDGTKELQIPFHLDQKPHPDPGFGSTRTRYNICPSKWRRTSPSSHPGSPDDERWENLTMVVYLQKDNPFNYPQRLHKRHRRKVAQIQTPKAMPTMYGFRTHIEILQDELLMFELRKELFRQLRRHPFCDLIGLSQKPQFEGKQESLIDEDKTFFQASQSRV